MEDRNIKKTFVKYISLNVLGMIGLSCYILADTFFVARGLGPDGLAALNLAIPIYSLVNGVGLMIGIGSATRYSLSKSQAVFTQAFYLVLLLSCLLFLCGLLFSSPLATLLGGDAVTHQMTATYLRVILCFAPMFMLNNLLICFVRNDNSPRLAMVAMLVGSFSNIILDYVFVFPLGMGMFGAALATGIAPVISLAILSAHIITKRNTFSLQKVALHLRTFADITSLGASSLVAELSSGIVIIVFNGIILRLAGNTGVAAYGVIANIALVVIAIFTGISQGMQPLLSRSHGMGDHHDTKAVLRYGFCTALAFAVVVYAITFVFAAPIVGAFNSSQDIRLAQIATKGLRIYFTAFAFVGINVLSATYFCSIDQPKQAFAISLLRGFLVIIPVAFLLSSLFGMTGVWLTLTVSEAIVLFFSASRFRRFR